MANDGLLAEATTADDATPNLPVVLEWDGEVAHLTLNRPQSLNALSVGMLDGLLEGLDQASGAHAVVISGAGRALCVGEDLRETLAPRTGQAEELRTSFEKLQQLTRRMIGLRAPVIVAAHGYAIGGGAELLLAADFVIADPALKLRFPEVAIGHAVTGGITVRLTATVGLMRAKDLLLTSRWVEGPELHALGIALELDTNATARATELAQELAAHPRRSMAATKQGIELASIPHHESVLASEVDAALYCFASDDATNAHRPFQDGSRSAVSLLTED